MNLRYRISRSHSYRRRKDIGIIFLGFLIGVAFFNHNLESDLGHITSDNDNTLQFSGPSNIAFDNEIDRKTVSYVTSFWAKDRPSINIIPHRREIEAALLANIHNPHIDQVVIFLDGVITTADDKGRGPSTCIHFYDDMKELNRQFRDASYSTDTHSVDPMSKVQCVDIMGAQPTYYQMFQHAISEIVTGDIVVMANADMAFDDSISKVQKLNEDVLLVLGTKGFSEEMPLWTRHVYDVIVGPPIDDSKTDYEQCRTNPWSWDTWIFHKKSLQGKLNEQHFKRPTIRGDHDLASFYMNENGAENAALWAMEQSSSFVYTLNACDEINSWSFHLTLRTHHNQGKSLWPNLDGGDTRNPNKVYIPRPWGGSKRRPRFNGMAKESPPYPPKWCEKPGGCFIS